MFNWYRFNRLGAAGVLAALFFGGVEILVFLADGAAHADLNSPAGLLGERIASHLAPPADRRALVYQLVLGLHLALVPLFAVLLWLRTRLRSASPLAHLPLALQCLMCAATLSSMVYVLAAELAVALPWRRALAWLALQLLLTAAAIALVTVAQGLAQREGALTLIWLYSSVGLLVQAIVFGIALLALRAHEVRLRLAEANAGLLATQSMLADTVRAAERTRIARDLHDAVGHHLTALNLHLDLALRQSGAGAPAALHTSRELASSLLAQVRVVVSSERREQIHLKSALETLCKGIPEPAIRLECGDDLELESAQLAHTLFYCVQEALTNALRHAGAGQLDIALRKCADRILLTIDDDGRGASGAADGNGMRGMRERIACAGGTIEAGPGPRRGHRLAIVLPLTGSAP
jgi:two-component system, NarL family, sensor histidine kinase DesK